MQWKPNTTVAAIVVDETERFLLVEEYSNERLVYNQPAGHLEQGETLIEAVIRETQEETAYLIEPQYLTGIYMYPDSGQRRTYLRFCFFAKVIRHDAEASLDEGIVQAKWLSRDDLVKEQEKHRSPMVLQCIDDYLAGQRHALDIMHFELPPVTSSQPK